MNAPAAPPNVNATAEKTSYVVLAKLNDLVDVTKFDASAWELVDTVQAANANAAIRAVATDHVNGPRTYVAVPQRSWRPVTAKIDTKTVLTLS